MLPLPTDLFALVLSFIPPKWTELSRESPLPEDGFIKMVLGSDRYRYKHARFFLLNEQYDFQTTLKRGEFNFATLESRLFLQFRNLPIPDVITVGHLFPQNRTSQAIEALYRFNAEICYEHIRRGLMSI